MTWLDWFYLVGRIFQMHQNNKQMKAVESICMIIWVFCDFFWDLLNENIIRSMQFCNKTSRALISAHTSTGCVLWALLFCARQIFVNNVQIQNLILSTVWLSLDAALIILIFEHRKIEFSSWNLCVRFPRVDDEFVSMDIYANQLETHSINNRIENEWIHAHHRIENWCLLHWDDQHWSLSKIHRILFPASVHFSSKSHYACILVTLSCPCDDTYAFP